ncbi:hypothetical protein [Geothrix sp. PMB-07]|nr:hypothetical protein [Geothrix sp. PMB-07]WLT31895.1 hypothetical protein Q9293_00920 [Geothrix sp. PMB-07]
MRPASARFILLPILALGGAALWGALECVALLRSRLGGRWSLLGKAHTH